MNINQGENHESVQLSQHSKSQNESNELLIDSKDKLKMFIDNNMAGHDKLSAESSETSHVSNNDCQPECLRTHNDTTRKHYHCNKCGKHFASLFNLRRHERFHNGLKQFKCDFCNKKFYRSDILRTHIEKIHYGKTFKCDLCDKSYRHKVNLKRHLEYHTRQYECEGCKKRFSKSTDFTKHKRNCIATIKHHFAEQEGTSEKEPFRCNTCGINFSLFQTFKQHIKSHFEKKQYKCDTCKVMFHRKDSLMSHLRSHIGDKLYHCNQCSRQFRTKHGLDHHKVVHTHPKMKSNHLKCKICQRMFNKSFNFKRHWLTVHRQESSNFKESKWKEMYECVENVMDKNDNEKMNTNSSQGGNINGRKLYTCTVCQKTFSRSCNLKQHMSSGHLQDYGAHMCKSTNSLQEGNVSRKQLYACNVCYEKFNRACNLKWHMSSVHSQKDCTFVDKKMIGESKRVESNKEERSPQRMKKLRCKLCQKILGNYIYFKQHWLTCHSPNNNPSECSKLEDMCELVELEIKRNSSIVVSEWKNEEIHPQSVRKFKCKTCQQILCDHLHKFKRHWLAKHSKEQVPSDKRKWRELYEVVGVEDTVDDAGETAVRCKICEKILPGRLHKFQRHWFAKHSDGNAPSDHSEWGELYEVVKLEVIESQASGEITGKINPQKKYKCKSCKKILCRSYKFKRHWLSFHAQENEPSHKWNGMYELVDASENENGNSDRVKKVRCKLCEKILPGRLHKFQRHWFAKHSNGNVPSDYSEWKEFYEVVEVEAEHSQDVLDNTDASENVNDKVNFKRTKKEGKKAQVKETCENEVKESTRNVSLKDTKWEKMYEEMEVEDEVNSQDAVDKNDKSATENGNLRVKKIKCKVCQKRLSGRSSNFKRHYFSFHSQECNGSESNRWKEMFEDVEEEAYQNENEGIIAKTKVKCKSCQTILNGCVSNFKQHWLRNHSKEDDLSEGRKWREMYEFVEVDLEQELMDGEFEAAGGLSERRNVYKRPRCICKECRKVFNRLSNFKQHWLNIHFTKNDAYKESRWKIMYEYVASDADDFQKDLSYNPKASYSRKQKRFQCNACSKWFSKRSNLTRHISSAHREEIVSPPGVSNVEMKCECNGKPQLSGEFENTCHPEIRKEREECVGDEGNSRCDGIEGDICVLEENRSGRFDEACPPVTIKVKEECQCEEEENSVFESSHFSGRFDEACPPVTVKVKAECQCEEEEENTVFDVVEGNILPPRESGCLEDGASRFSDEFEYSCLPEVCKVKVKCEYDEKETSHEFEEITYICPECGKLFNSATDLIQHDIDDH